MTDPQTAAMIAGASSIPIEGYHPVEWLRGRRTITVAVTAEEWDRLAPIKIGEPIRLAMED